jgi:hypothetical protein
MRLYRAICAWLEASAAAMSEPQEFGPEGAGPSQAEHAHSYTTPPELHMRSDRQSLDDDDSGSYRKRRPMGFTRNPI